MPDPTLVLADDTLAAATHAALHGWIASDALGEIGGEKREDEGVTGTQDRCAGRRHDADADRRGRSRHLVERRDVTA